MAAQLRLHPCPAAVGLFLTIRSRDLCSAAMTGPCGVVAVGSRTDAAVFAPHADHRWRLRPLTGRQATSSMRRGIDSCYDAREFRRLAMRAELLPGMTNVLRFPVERRARPTLELLREIARTCARCWLWRTPSVWRRRIRAYAMRLTRKWRSGSSIRSRRLG